MRRILYLVFLSSVWWSANSLAQVSAIDDNETRKQQPLWEAGAFAAGFVTPQYPAAADTQNNFIAAPYVIYRGDIIRVGEGSAVRAVALDTDWLEVDLSLDGSFNADSQTGSVRDGMPDLDYIFEIGPQVRMRLGSYSSGDAKLYLNIQTRAAYSTDFSSITHRGFVLHPELRYQHRNLLQNKDQFIMEFSPLWATEKLHDYFYQVDPAFQTAERASYDASGGYLGTNLSARYLFHASDDIRVFFGASVHLHAGAANEDSPLFVKKNTSSFGIGMIWRLYQSDAKARQK